MADTDPTPSPAPEREPQFTKGPWESSTGPYIVPSDGDWSVYPPLGEAGPVAIVGSEANAHLIAAAPDLYAALERIADSFLVSRAKNDGGEPLTAVISGGASRIRALLARARGES